MILVAPPAFDYARPDSVPDAVRLLGGEGAMVLAGGTDLVTMRAQGHVRPAVLVDIKHIGDLRGIEVGSDHIRIGATTTMSELVANAPSGLDAVLDGARLVGSNQIRNRATLVGNVARGSPAGDTLPGLLVHGATVEIASAHGSRVVPIHEVWTGPGQTSIPRDGLVTEVVVRNGDSASAYSRFTYRSWMDLAVVGVAVRLRMTAGVCTDAAVALGGAAPTPVLIAAAGDCLIGTAIESASINEAAGLVATAAQPISDIRGSADFRRAVIQPLAARVIAKALDRARSAANR